MSGAVQRRQLAHSAALGCKQHMCTVQHASGLLQMQSNQGGWRSRGIGG